MKAEFRDKNTPYIMKSEHSETIIELKSNYGN